MRAGVARSRTRSSFGARAALGWPETPGQASGPDPDSHVSPIPDHNCLQRARPSIVRRTMARPVDRDLDEVRARLAEWSSGRIARNAAVEIDDLAMPASTGYSGETFLFRARWADGEQRLVARLKPTGHSVFNSFDFANEYRAIDALANHTDLPMAHTFGYEEDARYFGVLFYVVEQ